MEKIIRRNWVIRNRREMEKTLVCILREKLGIEKIRVKNKGLR